MNPYGPLIKIGAYVLAALLFVGAVGTARAYRGRALRAEGRVEKLEQEVAVQMQNAALASTIMARNAERERTRAPKVATAQENVRNAKSQIPPACRPVLVPLARAADGVRRLQAERDGTAAPGSVVRPGSGSAPRG